MSMRYLRYSVLVGVNEDEFGDQDVETIGEVVSNDLREVINGDLDPAELNYGMMASDIEYQGDETRR